MFQVGLIGNKIDLCSIHRRVKNLDSMMMTNLPPVMLPPITDYGMLTPTLGIKVSWFTPSVSAKKRVSRYKKIIQSNLRINCALIIANLSKRERILARIKINIQILNIQNSLNFSHIKASICFESIFLTNSFLTSRPRNRRWRFQRWLQTFWCRKRLSRTLASALPFGFSPLEAIRDVLADIKSPLAGRSLGYRLSSLWAFASLTLRSCARDRPKSREILIKIPPEILPAKDEGWARCIG